MFYSHPGDIRVITMIVATGVISSTLAQCFFDVANMAAYMPSVGDSKEMHSALEGTRLRQISCV